MVTAVWSAKGGVGTTSVAAMLALAQVERAEDVVLVDTGFDIPALLGLDEPTGPGLAEWCALQKPDAAALGRLLLRARLGLDVLPRGAADFVGDPADLSAALQSLGPDIIIDCGTVSDPQAFAAQLVTQATTSLVVVRECYLNLRALQRCPITPTGVVLLKEPGRVLGRADVEAVAGAPVVAQVAIDRSVARSIDAGLAHARLPRPLIRQLGKVLVHAG